MTDLWFWFDNVTGVTILALALTGLGLRLRRIMRQRRIVLPEPVNELDREYLASIKRSTYLRLFVKLVFVVGGLIMVFDWPLFPLWRVLIIAALCCMIAETTSVDHVRDRLGQGAEADRERQEQIDRIEETGKESHDMLEREGIGDAR